MNGAPLTRAARRRGPSRPLERDRDLPLAQLEHAITEALAERARLEACEQLSRYLDSVHESERMDALQAVAS